MFHAFGFAVSGYSLSKPKTLRRLSIEWTVFCYEYIVFKSASVTGMTVSLRIYIMFGIFGVFAAYGHKSIWLQSIKFARVAPSFLKHGLLEP